MINPKFWKELDPEYQQQFEKYSFALPSRTFILQYLKEQQKALPLKEFIQAFDLEEQQITPFRQRLKAMQREGQISILNKEIRIFTTSDIVQGKVFAHPDGYGFFTPDNGDIDGFIPAPQMSALMHGDIITAQLESSKDGRTEYQPLEIIKRHNQEIAGILYKEQQSYWVRSQQGRIFHPIYIAPQELSKAKIGDMVRVKIIEYPTKFTPARGKIIKVLGNVNSPNIHNEEAIVNYQLPDEFSSAVKKEVKRFGDELKKEDYENRRDLRHLPFVTIDGADARDFDDAVYAEKAGANYRLYVAIADVSHYVKTGSALDEEALNRGTSVYFPNQVLPMLPEALSNGLCSLNPYCDRLVLLCTLTINPEGKTIRSAFSRAVIHSQARLTYEAVEEIIFQNGNNYLNKKISASLQNLKNVFQILNQQRAQRGALNFDLPENEFIYDEKGKIKDIQEKKRLLSHQLIEECMVAANVAAAKFLIKHKLPGLFRVHLPPTGRNKLELSKLAAEFKIFWNENEEINPLQIAELLQKVAQSPSHYFYENRILRLMMPAEYLPENQGHFGLALDEYCHFTSPIRRYPDLCVHRAIVAHLEKNNIVNNDLANTALICSQHERRAEDASREVVKSLKYQFLATQKQNIHDAFISRVNDYGLFITLEALFLEAYLHVRDIDDYLIFDPKNQRFISERSGKIYELGQKVQVRIKSISVEDKKMELELIIPRTKALPNKKAKLKKEKIKLAKKALKKTKKLEKSAKTKKKVKKSISKKRNKL